MIVLIPDLYLLSYFEAHSFLSDVKKCPVVISFEIHTTFELLFLKSASFLNFIFLLYIFFYVVFQTF